MRPSGATAMMSRSAVGRRGHHRAVLRDGHARGGEGGAMGVHPRFQIGLARDVAKGVAGRQHWLGQRAIERAAAVDEAIIGALVAAPPEPGDARVVAVVGIGGERGRIAGSSVSVAVPRLGPVEHRVFDLAVLRVGDQVDLIAARPGDADRRVAVEPEAHGGEGVEVVAGEAPPVEIAEGGVVTLVAEADGGDYELAHPLVVGLAGALARDDAHRSHVRRPSRPATMIRCVSPTKRPCSTTPGSAFSAVASATGSGIGPKAQS
jgi:hypothetical protein